MEGIVMWKRIVAALLSLTLTWGMSGGAFAAGNGYETVASSTDAFVKEIVRAQKAPDGYTGIRSAAQLQEALAEPDGLYILLADIDLGEWRPETGVEFSGIFNGNGYTISYTTSGRMDEGEAFERGLFSLLQDGVVANLRVKAVIDDSYRDLSQKTLYIGAIAARMDGQSALYNCTAQVQISVSTVEWTDAQRSGYSALQAAQIQNLEGATNYGIGGLVGRIEAGSSANIQFCRVQGEIGGVTCTGGLVGRMEAGEVVILGCENLASVSGIVGTGGIAGYASGQCNVHQCANRGQIIALEQMAGGLIGMDEDAGSDVEVCDCINMGDIICGARSGKGAFGGGIIGGTNGYVLRCVNTGRVFSDSRSAFCGGGDANFDANSSYCIADGAESGTGTLYSWGEASDAGGYSALNMNLVWKIDSGCPYPRVLLGEEVNQYYAAYEQILWDYCNSTYNARLLRYLQVNVAGTLGEEYRRGFQNELDVGWSVLNGVSDLLGGKTSGLDDISNYDALLTDLMISETCYLAGQTRLSAGCMDTISKFLDSPNLVEAGAKTTNILFEQGYQLAQVEYQRTALLWLQRGWGDSYAKYLQQYHLDSLKSMDSVIKGSQTVIDAVGTVSNATSVIGYVVDAIERSEKAAYEDMAYEIYNQYYDELGSLLQEMLYRGNSWEMAAEYDNQLEYMHNVNKLNEAIEEFCAQAEDEKLETEFMENLKLVGDNVMFTALAVGTDMLSTALLDVEFTKGLLESNYIAKFVPACGAELLQGLVLAKDAIQIGTGVGKIIGITNKAYNGNLLNSAGYFSDIMQQLVLEKYALYAETRSYETARDFQNALCMYLSLQLLACDYATNLAFNNYKEENALDDLKNIEVDLREMIYAFGTLG